MLGLIVITAILWYFIGPWCLLIVGPIWCVFVCGLLLMMSGHSRIKFVIRKNDKLS